MEELSSDNLTKQRIDAILDSIGDAVVRAANSEAKATKDMWLSLFAFSFFLMARADVAEETVTTFMGRLKAMDNISPDSEELRKSLLELCYEAAKIYRNHQGFEV